MKIRPIIEKDELARRLGTDDFGKVSRLTCMKIEKMQTVFEQLVDPAFHHQKIEVDSVYKGAVFLEKGPEFESSKLSRTLKNCKEIICYIATLGEGVEREIKQLMNGNRIAEAYILDAMASVAADNMVKMFHQHMKNNYENQGKQVTLCFSPGYCDWPITEQKKLFSVFDSDEIDVELTDSCFMQPRKSISGVFGITPKDLNPTEHSYNPCLECKQKNCSARRD